MRIVYTFFLWFIFIGCSSNKSNGSNATAIDKMANYIVLLDTTITVVGSESPFNGEIYYKAGWTDGNGENLFIISKAGNYNEGNGRAEVYGYHYIKKDNDWKINWRMSDFVNGQGCDLSIDIPKDYISIADLDKNTIVEIAFIYTLDNRCDAVVVPTKMSINAENNTYSISGFSKLSLGPTEHIMNQFLKEEGKPEVSFKAVSKNWSLLNSELENYYSRLWDRYVVQ